MNRKVLVQRCKLSAPKVGIRGSLTAAFAAIALAATGIGIVASVELDQKTQH